MAIRINLYHEVIKQQQVRRRDPLKLGMYGLIFIGVCFVGYYFCRLTAVHELNVRVAALQADWEKLEPKQKAAKLREDELNMKVKLADDLVRRIEHRFYWAPVFEQILQNVPREVQLTKLDGGLNKDHPEEITLAVSGLASSAAPRKIAEELRTAIGEKFRVTFKKVDSHFTLLDDSDASVTVEGKALPTANFAIEFQLRTQPDIAPAAVPVRTRKFAAQ